MLIYDLAGQVFSKLKVRCKDGKIGTRTAWLCDCECGGTIRTIRKSLRNRSTKSCGCLRQKVGRANKTHGATVGGKPTVEYFAYINAKRRCNSPKAQAYGRYGARGIKFNFTSFEEFFFEVGPRPSINHSLDRINNDGHYEKGNVKWSTYKEQANNRHTSLKYVRMLEEQVKNLEEQCRLMKMEKST
jgi:hypothetical protein